MKSRKSWLFLPAAGALMLTGNLLAQDMPPAASSTSSAATTESAVYNTPQGELTVHSSPAPAPMIGPAPAFDQLTGGGQAITEEQAAAYPPLANDFINADRNHNHNISKTEYKHWVAQLK